MNAADPTPMTPLQVTAHLQTGVALPPNGISLDGLLASLIRDRGKAAASAHTGAPVPGSVYDGGTTIAQPADVALPLARCERGTTWHWAATAALPTTLGHPPQTNHHTQRIQERTVTQVSSWVPRALHPDQGRYRQRRLPTTVTLTRTLVWSAVGAADDISDLLADAIYIGKGRSRGEGRVLAWEVTPTDRAPAAAGHLHPDGTLGRPTPHACLTDLASHLAAHEARRLAAEEHHLVQTGAVGLRPPYWHPATRGVAHRPIAVHQREGASHATP